MSDYVSPQELEFERAYQEALEIQRVRDWEDEHWCDDEVASHYNERALSTVGRFLGQGWSVQFVAGGLQAFPATLVFS